MIDSIDVESRNSDKIEQERDPEVKAKPKRRRFTAKYKLWALGQANKLKDQPGELGKFLRKEGLYSSYITLWRREKRKGGLNALGKKRGRPADPDAKLLRELESVKTANARLEHRLQRAEAIIELQKKVSALLGLTEANEET